MEKQRARRSGRTTIKKRNKKTPRRYDARRASKLSQGAHILLQILRDETERKQGEAVLLATLGTKLKSTWEEKYCTGCLKGLVHELTKAGRATRGTKGKSTATLSLSQSETSTSKPKGTNSRSPGRSQRTDKKNCPHYMRTGRCSYSSNCKFDHPPKSHSMPSRAKRSPVKSAAAKERLTASGNPRPISRSSHTTSPIQHRGAGGKNNRENHTGAKGKRRQATRGCRNSPRNSSRNPRRMWFERCIKHGKDFSRRDEGRKFLSAAVTEFDDDGPSLLYRLVAPSEFGLKMLVKAIVKVSRSEPQFLTSSVLAFLERLGQDDMCAGTCTESLMQILEVVATVPGLLPSLAEAIKSNRVPTKHIKSLSWFMIKLGCGSKSSRQDPSVHDLVDALCDHQSPYATKLRTVFRGATNVTMESTAIALEDLAGGRHDNDFEDFRLVDILPSVEEIQCEKDPYLPEILPLSTCFQEPVTWTNGDIVYVNGRKAVFEKSRAELAVIRWAEGPEKGGIDFAEMSSLSASSVDTGEIFRFKDSMGMHVLDEDVVATREAALLERQFRILREDMIGPMREALRLLLSPRGTKLPGRPKRQRTLTSFQHVAFEHVDCKRRSAVLVSFRLPPNHPGHEKKRKKREDYWEIRGKRTLPRDSFVGFILGNEIQYFATVVHRDGIARLDNEGVAHPLVGLNFHADDLSDILLHLGNGVVPNLKMVQAGTNLFTYKPVLKCLQQMDSVPLGEELVLGQPSGPPEYLEHVHVGRELECTEKLLQKEIPNFKFDPAQREAMERAMTSRVSLTHGPPGTGKTFVGVELANIILDRCPEETILCVCYTNHALDDFLVGLLDKGVKSIARIGGRCTEEALKQYNVRELAQEANYKFDRAETRHYAQIMNALDEGKEEIEQVCEKLKSAHLGTNDWNKVAEHIKDGTDQDIKAFDFLDTGNYLPERSGDWQTVVDGKEIQDDYLWKQWIKNKNAGHFEPQVNAKARTADFNPWVLGKQERQQLKARWEKEIFSHDREMCVSLLEGHDKLLNDKQQLRQGSWSKVLANKRVIGCTTTGAAMYKELLNTAKASVLIIEEAGEVLEAHVLSSLQSTTKHLILIGDHQQLRPKLEHYPLSVEAPHGHLNFNISLFERLVKSGMKHGTLQIQHRMRPEISSLIKKTYPKLKDSYKTSGREHLRGAASSVIFIDHDEQEQSGGEAEKNRKTNRYEVGMVRAIVKYLVQQGYKSTQLVVLTPYLGQLQELQRALSNDWQVLLDQMDLNELSNAGLEPVDTTHTKRRGCSVRVATIDNFQGEEADVVIISLVRCNQKKIIGFLSEDGRVNVLLSRARDALIMIGSQNTLRQSSNSKGREIWQRIFENEHLHISKGFPAICRCHKKAPPEPLSTPEAFKKYVPNGGCGRKCFHTLKCGHQCPLRCHPYDDNHSNIVCTEIINKRCEHGHLIPVKCGSTEAPVCKTCTAIALLKRQERAKLKDLSKQKEKVEAEAKKKRIKEEMQAKILRQKISLKQAEVRDMMNAAKAKKEREHLQRELALKEKHAHREMQAEKLRQKISLKQAEVRDMMDAAKAKIEREHLQHELALKEKHAHSDAVAEIAEICKMEAENLERQEREREEEAALKIEHARRELQSLCDKKNNSNKKLTKLEEDLKRKLDQYTKDMERTRAATVKRTNNIERKAGVTTHKPRKLPGPIDTRFAPKRNLHSELFKRMISCVNSHLIHTIREHFAHFGVRAGNMAKGDENLKGQQTAASLMTNSTCCDGLTIFDPKSANSKVLVRSVVSQYGNVRIDIGTLMHELGHAFDFVWGMKFKRFPCLSKSKQVTNACAKEKSRFEQSYFHTEAEFTAEVFSRFALDPRRASKEFPMMAGILVKELPKVIPALSNWDLANNPLVHAGKLMEVLDRMVPHPPVTVSNTYPGRENWNLNDTLEKQEVANMKQHSEGGQHTGRRRPYVICLITEDSHVAVMLGDYIARRLFRFRMQNASSYGHRRGVMRPDLAKNIFQDLEKRVDEHGFVVQLQAKGASVSSPALAACLRFFDTHDDLCVPCLWGSSADIKRLQTSLRDANIDSDTIACNVAAMTPDQIFGSIIKMLQADAYRLGDVAKHSLKEGIKDEEVTFAEARQLTLGIIKQQRHRVIEDGITQRDSMKIIHVDIIKGLQSVTGTRSLTPQQKLDNMIGMNNAKAMIAKILAPIKLQKISEKLGLAQSRPRLNILLIGNPGTGKTRFADVLRAMLIENKVTNKKFIELNPDSQELKDMQALFTKYNGGVIFIDEFHQLADDEAKKQIAKSMVGYLEQPAYRKTVVIGAGYPKEITNLLKVDPGLDSRFSKDLRIHLQDYCAQELGQILDIFCKKASYPPLEGVIREKALDTIMRRQKWELRPSNGRGVEKFFEGAQAKQRHRLTQSMSKTGVEPSLKVMTSFTESDITDPPPLTLKKFWSDTERNFPGNDKIFEALRQIEKTVLTQRKEKITMPQYFNFFLKGPPGTGKTTLAREVFARFFCALGILPCSTLAPDPKQGGKGAQLQAEYVGQSAGKVREVFENGSGQTIFIDEISGFFESGYRKEITKTMVSYLEDYPEKFVFIAADYPENYERMKTLDSGLSSRFTYVFDIPTWDAELSTKVVLNMLRNDYNRDWSKQSCLVLNHMKILTEIVWTDPKNKSTVGFASGRTCRTLAAKLFSQLQSSTVEGAIKSVFAQMKATLMSDVATASGKAYVLPQPDVQFATQSQRAQQKRQPRQYKKSHNAELPQLAKDLNLDNALGRDLLITLADPSLTKEDKRKIHLQLLKQANDDKEMLMRLLKEKAEALRKWQEAERRRIEEEERKRKEEEARKLAQMKKEKAERVKRAKQEAQRHVRKMGRCVANYEWIHQGNGLFRCSAGGHTCQVPLEIAKDLE